MFAGHREDAPRLVATADIVALPSLFEGLSIALLEAMAVGRAIAVTSAGGNVEVVQDGREALVVRPDDAAGLAEALPGCSREPELRHRLGAAAQRRVVDFDIRNAVVRQEAVYTALLDQGARTAVPVEETGKSSSQRSA